MSYYVTLKDRELCQKAWGYPVDECEVPASTVFVHYPSPEPEPVEMESRGNYAQYDTERPYRILTFKESGNNTYWFQNWIDKVGWSHVTVAGTAAEAEKFFRSRFGDPALQDNRPTGPIAWYEGPWMVGLAFIVIAAGFAVYLARRH